MCKKEPFAALFLYAQGRIRKYAAEAACAPRGEQGENLPCSITQGRMRKYAAEAACVSRGGPGGA